MSFLDVLHFPNDLSHDFAIHRKQVGRPGGFAGPFFGLPLAPRRAEPRRAEPRRVEPRRGEPLAAGSSGAACGKMLDILGECPNNYK